MTPAKLGIGAAEWLHGNRTMLRLIDVEDCTDAYVGWLQDPEVNRYLETRFVDQSLDTIRAFVSHMRASSHSYLFGIFERESRRHVGNVKLGPIEPHHRYADVSYFLGERDAWGKGYATDAVRTATRFGFERLGLHRVQAGFYETNVGSHRVLEKAGFAYEGRLVKKLRQSPDGAWEDHVWFGALADTWSA